MADLNLDNTSIGLLIALPTLRLTALPFLVERDFTYNKTQVRQYDAVEPENRLVARSLERAWEGLPSTQRGSNRDRKGTC